MIEAKNLTKTFGELTALNNIDLFLPDGKVFGLIGSNGSGKSTLLRIVAGVYKQDSGDIIIDGEKVFDNINLKNKVFFLGDTLYFFGGSTLNEMAKFYAKIYPDFSFERMKELNKIFPIMPDVKISTMSKGMQRQAALILAFAARPKYLLLDEAFDGLDPVMRENLKRIMARDIEELNMTVIIASHNLRELEDMCDTLGLLHNGEIIYSDTLDNLKSSIHKIQVGFKEPPEINDFKDLNILKYNTLGSVVSLIVKGELSEITDKINGMFPLFMDVLSPTLEELFIFELGGIGYNVAEITA